MTNIYIKKLARSVYHTAICKRDPNQNAFCQRVHIPAMSGSQFRRFMKHLEDIQRQYKGCAQY